MNVVEKRKQPPSASMYTDLVIRERVKLKPNMTGRNFRDVLQDKIARERSGRCCRHGYVVPGSVILQRVAPGIVDAAALNGDVIYDVEYAATVCNPLEGSVVRARVVNMNKFGLLAHCRLADAQERRTTNNVLEIVIARHQHQLAAVDRPQLPSLDSVAIGSWVLVEVRGKALKLDDVNITRIGIVTAIVAEVKEDQNGNDDQFTKRSQLDPEANEDDGEDSQRDSDVEDGDEGGDDIGKGMDREDASTIDMAETSDDEDGEEDAKEDGDDGDDAASGSDNEEEDRGKRSRSRLVKGGVEGGVGECLGDLTDCEDAAVGSGSDGGGGCTDDDEPIMTDDDDA